MWLFKIDLQDLKMFLFVYNENTYSIVSLVTKNLSTYVQSILQGFIGWPRSQEACSLINRINMHSQYKKGCTKGHPSKTVAILTEVVTVG